MAMNSATDKAWTYRRIMDDLMAQQQMNKMMEMGMSEPGTPESPETPSKMVLFDFNSPDDAASWNVVLDGVMGGLSTGNVSTKNGKMMFYGTTSLANNGGFSSVRTGIMPGSLTGFNTLRLRVKGDGRTYILSTKGGAGNHSYWTRFKTTRGEWTTVDV